MLRHTPRSRWVLVGICLLAFALRTHHLDQFSFWLDEGLTPLRSGYALGDILRNEIVLQGTVTQDTHPPLYYLLIHASRQLFGESDFAFRYPSTLAGLILPALLYGLGRRLYTAQAGILAALFTAINPLQIWYAQEARMYTLLVTLAAGASAALWYALADDGSGRWRRAGLIYGALAGLALYTHYTAAFLILGQAPLWVWVLWRHGQKRLILAGAVAATLAAWPLLPVTIPRLFTGAEASYQVVSPWVMLQDVVRGFGFGRTAPFGHPLITGLAVALTGLLLAGLLAQRSAHTNARRLWLLIYLLAAVTGIAALSQLKPMYLGPHHSMIGSPAFLLLLAGGVVSLEQWLGAGRQRVAAITQTGATFVVLLSAAVPLYHLYTDYRVAKDDYRGLAAYVDQAAGANDSIVYNNATLLPVQQHYQQRQDLAATALPVYPYPVRPEEFAALENLNQTVDRIWFMPEAPQAGRDRFEEVRGWLDAHLLRVDDRSFYGSNADVRIIAYRTGETVTATLPDKAEKIAWQGDGLPALAGVFINTPQPVTATALWFDLYWQAPAEAAPGRGVHFALRSPDGLDWAQQDYPIWREPPPEKANAGLMRGAYRLDLPPGLPPGVYELRVSAWDSAAGQLSGPEQGVAEIRIGRISSTFPHPADRRLLFANGLEIAPVPADKTVRPGAPLPITLYWRAAQPFERAWAYRVEAVAPNGSVLSRQTGPLAPAWLDSPPTGALIATPIGLDFPAQADAQTYSLRWTLFADEETLPGRPSWRPWFTPRNHLARVSVEAWPLVKSLPTVDNLVELVDSLWDYGVQLRGYTAEREANQLIITLYWQASGPLPASYYTFVHLLTTTPDATTTGSISPAQSDQIPVGWLRPTTGWRAGEILADRHTLALPADLPPGHYAVTVGFYRRDVDQRLPVAVGGRPQANDELWLTTLTLP